MKRYFDYSTIFTKIGFCAGLVSNLFLILLTVVHVKKITGTYKLMVITFASTGIFFSGWELIARPFMHNYNNALVYFSLNTSSQSFFQFAIAFYAGIYEAIVAFLAIQFIYRYVTLFHPNFAAKFDGKGILIWLPYSLIPGAIYCTSFYIYCMPDKFSDDYVREAMLEGYEMAIEEVPRFVIVSFNNDETLRWNNLSFLIQGVSVIGLHYLVIIFFGLKTHFHMKKKLEGFSKTYQRLQKQLFRALVVQTLAPTFLFVLPAGPILLGPLISPIFRIEISLQTGWLCSLFSLYPPIDSIAFMVIVTEYRKLIRGCLRDTVGVYCNGFLAQVKFLMSPDASVTDSTTENSKK
uniref:Seven TM Receptor n=1 Tax=Caenorhabditis tropicalis TaxID=1561998 RepID=A0A1I7TB56_9PELO